MSLRYACNDLKLYFFIIKIRPHVVESLEDVGQHEDRQLEPCPPGLTAGLCSSECV